MIQYPVIGEIGSCFQEIYIQPIEMPVFSQDYAKNPAKPAAQHPSSSFSWKTLHRLGLKVLPKSLKIVSSTAKIFDCRGVLPSVHTALDLLYWINAQKSVSNGRVNLRLRFIYGIVAHPVCSYRNARNYDYRLLLQDLLGFGYSWVNICILMQTPFSFAQRAAESVLQVSQIKRFAEIASAGIGQIRLYESSYFEKALRQIGSTSEFIHSSCRLVQLAWSLQVGLGLLRCRAEGKWQRLHLLALAGAVVDAVRALFYFSDLAGYDLQEKLGSPPHLKQYLVIIGSVIGLTLLYLHAHAGSTPEEQYSYRFKQKIK